MMRLAAPILKRGLLPSPPAGRLASRIDAPDRDMSLMSLQFVGTLGQNSIGRRPARIGFTPAGRATSAIAHRVLPAVDRSDRDRKSVVSGKSVSVRVDLGGRSIITKKINIQQILISH